MIFFNFDKFILQIVETLAVLGHYLNYFALTGLTFSPGKMVKRQKRYCFKHFQQLGFGKSSSEVYNREEISKLLKK